MTPITGLKSIVSCMAKASKSSSDEVAFKLFKKMTSGYGTDLSPIVYKGKNLDELPDMIKGMLTGLKKPTVTVNGRSRVNGQGIFGFKIQDGNKTISTSALGVDLTRGEPILQLRGTYGNGTQQAVRFNTVFDTNLTGASALRGDVFVDRKLAQQLGISDEIIEGISKKPSAKEIKGITKELKEFVALEGHNIRSIDACMPEIVQIASKTGKVTSESATEAFEAITKAMGQQGKIKLNIITKGGVRGNGGSFNPNTGIINLNLTEIKSYQELATTLSHELTHMEDCIMLYKYLGPDKFKQLPRFKAKFNQEWYEEMSKYITKKHFAFQNKGKTIRIVTHDGIEITDPKLIKEYLAQQPKIKKFDIDTMVREELADGKSLGKYTGEYGKYKELYTYITSDIEKHARTTESEILKELKRNSTYRKKRPGIVLEEYQNGLTSEFARIFKNIETKLGRHKNEKFNRLYNKALYDIDPELGKISSAISKKSSLLRKGVGDKQTYARIQAELKELETKLTKIMKTRYASPTSKAELRFKILKTMQKKLGIKPYEGKDLYSEALRKLDPKLYSIRERLCEGLPSQECDKLIQKQKGLISRHYGSELAFGKRLSQEIRDIKLQELNGGI